MQLKQQQKNKQQESRKPNTYSLKRTITLINVQPIVASLPTKKIPGSDGITHGFYQTFKKKVISILHKLFQKTEEGRALPNSFYKLTKDITRKEN